MHLGNTLERLRHNKHFVVGLFIGVSLYIVVSFVQMLNSPDKLYSDLAQASAGAEALPLKRFDADALIANERERVKSAILVDLKATNADASIPVDSLLLLATSYLNSREGISQWLSAELQDISVPQEQWVVDKLDKKSESITAGDRCLLIKKQKQGWQLVNIGDCG